jgi:methylenetetrahydrofolate dehydrogenase (NADP+)/methenyltetrahydrofolate cyclohydrolase
MIIDGRKIADGILAEAAKEVKALRQTQGKPPYLAAVLVGDDAGSRGFLELKKKGAEGIGIDFRIYEFPEKISNGELRKKLNQIVKATTCGGMIVELPLPPHLNTQAILNVVPEGKDPDVLSQKAQGAFFAGRSEISPPSVETVKSILEEYKIEPKGKTAAVFGYGLLVGKPVSHWLASQGAAVTVINEFTSEPAELSKKADIIVSGVGKPGLIGPDMIKEGAVVIDFGYSGAKTQNEILGSPEHSARQNVLGDVDFEEVGKKASLITPVPGGTGPIVVAAVLKNFVKMIKNA